MKNTIPEDSTRNLKNKALNKNFFSYFNPCKTFNCVVASLHMLEIRGSKSSLYRLDQG